MLPFRMYELYIPNTSAVYIYNIRAVMYLTDYDVYSKTVPE